MTCPLDPRLTLLKPVERLLAPIVCAWIRTEASCCRLMEWKLGNFLHEPMR
jgi:hypothetical protein